MHVQGPILAIDVQYTDEDIGYAAGVLFDSIDSSVPSQPTVHVHQHVLPYEAGAFYKRELPPILSLLDKISPPPSLIIVDGFVDLDGPEHPGLGRHLYNRLDGRAAVIGVAKNPYRRFDDERKALPTSPHVGVVYRGSSTRALFVTSAGIALSHAVQVIKDLDGRNRIPTMLKLVDREARAACTEGMAAHEPQ